MPSLKGLAQSGVCKERGTRYGPFVLAQVGKGSRDWWTALQSARVLSRTPRHLRPLGKNSLFHARPKDPNFEYIHYFRRMVKEALLLKVSSVEPHF
jgi:hypothetical protein